MTPGPAMGNTRHVMSREWQCANCGNTVPRTFDVCWNCGADRDGKADPDFLPVAEPAEVPATDLASTWPAKALVVAGSAFCAMVFCGTELFMLLPDADSKEPLSDGARLWLWLTAACGCAALGAFAAFTVHYVDPQPREQELS